MAKAKRSCWPGHRREAKRLAAPRACGMLHASCQSRAMQREQIAAALGINPESF